MEYMDGDNSYLISASRDHTIKIWKWYYYINQLRHFNTNP
jgi:hypothetical protein